MRSGRGRPVRRSQRGTGRLHTGQAPAQQASRTQAQDGCGCRTCQPVSHQGTRPATTPGASTKNAALPAAAVGLRMARSSRPHPTERRTDHDDRGDTMLATQGRRRRDDQDLGGWFTIVCTLVSPFNPDSVVALQGGALLHWTCIRDALALTSGTDCMPFLSPEPPNHFGDGPLAHPLAGSVGRLVTVPSDRPRARLRSCGRHAPRALGAGVVVFEPPSIR